MIYTIHFVKLPTFNFVQLKNWQHLLNKTTKNTFTITLRRIVFVILLSVSSVSLFAQENNDYNRFEVNISPRITIGYTFGAGVNCGVEIGASIYKFNDMMLGANLNYCMVFLKKGSLHKIAGVTLSAETHYVAGKIGLGRVSRSWGRRNVNKASTFGLMIDAAVCVDEYRAPWIGFKTFVFNRSKWPHYNLPTYTSTFAYFKSQDIKIYKQPPPKIVEEDDEE